MPCLIVFLAPLIIMIEENNWQGQCSDGLHLFCPFPTENKPTRAKTSLRAWSLPLLLYFFIKWVLHLKEFDSLQEYIAAWSNLGCTNLSIHWIPLFCTGYYVYIETSWQSANDTAILLSPIVPLTSGKPNNMVCLQFWYHMYGQHVDTLNLFMPRAQQQQLPPSPIWTKSGTQGNRWRLGQVAVSSRSPFQVWY